MQARLREAIDIRRRLWGACSSPQPPRVHMAYAALCTSRAARCRRRQSPNFVLGSPWSDASPGPGARCELVIYDLCLVCRCSCIYESLAMISNAVV